MDAEQESILTSNSTNWTTRGDIPKYSSDSSSSLGVYRIFLELFTVICFCSLVSNILQIFLILKFKKLYEHLSNKLLLHVNIMQAIFLFCTPLQLRVIYEFEDLSFIPSALACSFNEVENVIIVALHFFLMLLLFEWYCHKYYETTYVKFMNVYLFFIVIIYFFALCASVFSIHFCIKQEYLFLTVQIIGLLYILIILLIIIVNIMHRIKQWRARRLLTADYFQSNSRPNTGLAITNIFVLVWCPPTILAIAAICGWHNTILLVFFTTTGFSSPIFNLLYLFWYDNAFNSFIKKVFKCQCNDYSNENLEDTSVSFGANGVQIQN